MPTFKAIFNLAVAKKYKPFHNIERITAPNKELTYKQLLLIELWLIQRWLFDYKKICISIKAMTHQPDEPKFYPHVMGLSHSNMGEELVTGFLLYDTYDKAMMEGIFEALKLINDD
jgi:hypothetical protein